ncbi:MAG: hypothetical protein MI725_09980 [Pirellulales bacterium]|nr:hypothetical protein [Pirellulales bacterium]
MPHLRLTWMLLATLFALIDATQLDSQETRSEPQIARIRRIVLSRSDDPAAVAYLVQLARDLPDPDAAVLYRQLADEYLQRAKYDTASRLLRQLVDQFPQQAPALDGALTFTRLYASSEVARTQQARQPSRQDSTALPTHALQFASRARTQISALAQDPAFSFQCAVAARGSGRTQLAQSFLTPLEHNPRTRSWHRRAQAEAWLASDRQLDPPLPVRRCSHTAQRPQLDGKLVESCWQVAARRRDETTSVCLARDEEFLYLAVRCEKMPKVEYAPDNRKRSYDADLSNQDHVRLRLDLDRDYATCFELSVDHRGWTADRCWLAPGWNPRWFVAARQDETHWRVEAAIPWTELLWNAPAANDAWAIAVERVLPEAPAAAEFELLVFD